MSIVPLMKATLAGPAVEKDEVLSALQALGCMHLVALRPGAAEAVPDTGRPEHTYEAFKHLSGCPRRRRAIPLAQGYDLDAIVEQALENKRRTRRARDWRDHLCDRLRQREPWGDFAFPPAKDLDGYRLWFYVVPHYKMRDVGDPGLPWEVVSRDQRNSYVVIVAREEPPADAMPVPRSHTGRLSLAELRNRLERIDLELDELMLERESLTRYLYFLAANIARAEDRAALERAHGLTRDEDGVFAVQGWVPAARVPALEALAREQGLACVTEAPAGDEEPPTLLANRGPTAGGEEVVEFYQLPGYRGWDPSAVVFFSFAVFFAMILADAGYALVMGAILLLLRRRMAASVTGRRLASLGWAITACSLAYGVLVGSYFGVGAPPGSLPGRLHVLDLDDFEAMMRLSVYVGAAHLLIANALTAWNRGSRPRALPPLGWMAAIAGALMLWEDVAGARGVLAGGLAAVVAFSDDRPIRTARDALARLGRGLLGLTGVTKAFGDVLSYLRLFALGLASASLAVTFNQLAADAAGAVSGIGLLLYVLILLVGHALNFTLCIVSGVVHGLRLNVIEFYNWAVSEEGYPFRAFAKKEERTWTN